MKRFPNNNYKEYKEEQIRRTEEKFYQMRHSSLNAIRKQLEMAWKFLPELREVKTIGLMGIRGGNEYRVFKGSYPNAKVYGVDISPMVEGVGKNCYCYDFNKLPKNWVKNFDLLYSNSLDHAFNVKKTIKEWERVTIGYMLLVLSESKISKSDVYSFTEDDAIELFKKYTIIQKWRDHSDGLPNNLIVLLKI